MCSTRPHSKFRCETNARARVCRCVCVCVGVSVCVCRCECVCEKAFEAVETEHYALIPSSWLRTGNEGRVHVAVVESILIRLGSNSLSTLRSNPVLPKPILEVVLASSILHNLV